MTPDLPGAERLPAAAGVGSGRDVDLALAALALAAIDRLASFGRGIKERRGFPKLLILTRRVRPRLVAGDFRCIEPVWN